MQASSRGFLPEVEPVPSETAMPEPSEGRNGLDPVLLRIRSGKPLPHEILALVFVAIGIPVLENLPVTYPRSALVLAFALPMALSAAVALAALLIRRWLRPGKDQLGSEALLVVRGLLVLGLVLPVHFLLKSFIFLINSSNWDLALFRLDRTVHFGFSPSIFLVTMFHQPWLLRFVDVIYSRMYFVVVVVYLGVLLVLLTPRSRLVFLGAYTMVWIFGIGLYIALPSWGPVFVFSDTFSSTLRHMPITVHVQRGLYEEIRSLVQIRWALVRSATDALQHFRVSTSR